MAALTGIRVNPRAHCFVLRTPWSAPLPHVEGHAGAAFVVTKIFVRGLLERYGRIVIVRTRDRELWRVPLDCRVGARIQQGIVRQHPGVGVHISKGLLIPPTDLIRLHVAGTDGRPTTVELDGLFSRDVG